MNRSRLMQCFGVSLLAIALIVAALLPSCDAPMTNDGLPASIYAPGDVVASIVAASEEEATDRFHLIANDQELSGEFQIRPSATEGTWDAVVITIDEPELDPGLSEDLPVMKDDSQDYHDIISFSRSTSDCSAWISGYDDTWWDWMLSAWYDDGDSYGGSSGGWSGCGSSGTLTTTLSFYGASLSWAFGIPSGVTVAYDSAVKKQYNVRTSIGSGRYTYQHWCMSAVEGFLTHRTLTVSLSYKNNSGGTSVVEKTYTSYLVWDAIGRYSC